MIIEAMTELFLAIFHGALFTPLAYFVCNHSGEDENETPGKKGGGKTIKRERGDAPGSPFFAQSNPPTRPVCCYCGAEEEG